MYGCSKNNHVKIFKFHRANITMKEIKIGNCSKYSFRLLQLLQVDIHSRNKGITDCRKLVRKPSIATTHF